MRHYWKNLMMNSDSAWPICYSDLTLTESLEHGNMPKSYTTSASGPNADYGMMEYYSKILITVSDSAWPIYYSNEAFPEPVNRGNMSKSASANLQITV
jgi:hypothetical protein